MKGCLQFITLHSAFCTPSNAPVAVSVCREQLGTRLRRRLGGKRRALGTRQPSWVRNHGGTEDLRSEMPPSKQALPAFKFLRLYGPRAESPRSARAALLQAAAPLFNNPRAACRREQVSLFLTGKPGFSTRAPFPSARRSAAEVSVTGQFEASGQNDETVVSSQ